MWNAKCGSAADQSRWQVRWGVKMALLNLASWVECTEVEGPGRRFALWTQGCPIQCPGCCNPHMFDFKPATLVESDEVFGWILAARDRYGIEGVTFLGGEPMVQAVGLADVARRCQQSGLSVMTFTGYTLEYLRRHPLPGVEELLRHTDVLVDGPFLQDQPDHERNWVGSKNQRFHFLTDRYGPEIIHDPRYRDGVELRVLSNGKVLVVGSPFVIQSIREKMVGGADGESSEG